MASDGTSQKNRYDRPTQAFAEIMTHAMRGNLIEEGDYVPFMFRAFVYAIDTIGGRLENKDATFPANPVTTTIVNKDGKKTTYRPKVMRGPKNPPDSLKARIIGNNIDQFVANDDLRTYWPMFPGLCSPSPGELVYVVFEDSTRKHGLWLSKVPVDMENDSPARSLFADMLAMSAGDQPSIVKNFNNGPEVPPAQSAPQDARTTPAGASSEPAITRNFTPANGGG